MNKQFKDLRVAIVTDHIQSSGGAVKVTKEIGNLFNNPDYFFLFGDRDKAKEILDTDNIYFSKLQKFPFLKRLYKYTYFLWPIFIETFDLKDYDLVISSSFSVAHGVITSEKSKHISYIHTPMRYVWDLKDMYFNRKNFGLLRMIPISILTNYLRVWDLFASDRSDILIANSNFVSKRISKYWKRESVVIYPPVDLYEGEIVNKKDDYFVTGTPFEINRNGEFLMDMVIKNNLKLKVVGTHKDLKRWERKYKGYSNIEFLGFINDKEKFNIFSKSKGYIACGIEDFGIFPIESISCGTPVIALKKGGYCDYVIEGVNGVLFDNLSLDSFTEALERFNIAKWDYVSVSESVKGFNKELFVKKFKSVVLKSIDE